MELHFIKLREDFKKERGMFYVNCGNKECSGAYDFFFSDIVDNEKETAEFFSLLFTEQPKHIYVNMNSAGLIFSKGGIEFIKTLAKTVVWSKIHLPEDEPILNPTFLNASNAFLAVDSTYSVDLSKVETSSN